MLSNSDEHSLTSKRLEMLKLKKTGSTSGLVCFM